MKELATKLVLDYLSNNLNDSFRDEEFFKQKALKELSQMICKTLELTNFIEDSDKYKLVVEKESDTVLNLKLLRRNSFL